jgi:hypothetical protein
MDLPHSLKALVGPAMVEQMSQRRMQTAATERAAGSAVAAHASCREPRRRVIQSGVNS